MCLPFEVVFISTNIQSWFGPLSISLDFEEDRIRGCWNISLKYFVFVVENIRRRTVIVLKLYRGFILKRKRNINQQKKLGLPWRCLEFFNFFFFKSCLWIWVLIGGERCLKVTLQKCAPENFHSCRWGAEQRVLRPQIQEQGPPSAWSEIFFQAVEINLYHVYF